MRNPNVRAFLVFLAAATAALAAAPPVDLPGWAAALIAAAAAGFAGLGLLPPSWRVNTNGTRAAKRSSDPLSVPPRPTGQTRL